jgi:Sel1 repeat
LVLVSSGLAVRGIFDPARYDYQQAMVNFQYHPIASIFGAVLPAVILSPLVYWMFGWILRRSAVRFKVCEHCAETIKAEAKACRYCGRDVADANLLGSVQGASAADVVSAMDQAQSHKPRLPLKLALVPASVLGLVLLLGGVVPWLADTHKTLVPLSTKVTADQIEEADTAYRKRDFATALRLIRPLADDGNAVSQTFLGAMYFNGDGVAQNYAEAAKWYRVAADRGNAPAQDLLGSMYLNGHGVQQSYAEAAKLYRVAADQMLVRR